MPEHLHLLVFPPTTQPDIGLYLTVKAIESSIDYIHRNPVERKLCRLAIDFRWSSARYYLAQAGSHPFEGLPKVDGLRTAAFDPSASR